MNRTGKIGSGMFALVLAFVAALAMSPIGNEAVVAQEETEPIPFTIIARPDDPSISLWGATSDATATLAVYEHEGGTLLDVVTLQTDTFGRAGWGGKGSGIYLPPSTYIEATDDSTGQVETLTVVDMAYEAIDVEGDVALGYAPRGAAVDVSFWRPEATTTPYVEEHLQVAAGEDGRWRADFGAAGIDIPPYANHSASVPDGDRRFADKTVDRLPYIFDSEDNWIWIHSFTPESEITVEIFDGPGGDRLDEPYQLNTDGAGRAFFSAREHEAELQPGYYSVVADVATGFAKAHELQSVNLQVDVDGDVAFGNGEPGARPEQRGARILVRYQLAYEVGTYADVNGDWVADFGAIGVDLTDEISNQFWNTEVWVYDADGDSTWDRWPDPSLSVTIDIKPGSYPNSINLGANGVVPVAVLTTDEFDASTVDPDSVVFAGAEPLRWAMEDVDYDGDLDLIFHFKTQELDLYADSTDVALTGQSFGGVLVGGTDTVNIVP